MFTLFRFLSFSFYYYSLFFTFLVFFLILVVFTSVIFRFFVSFTFNTTFATKKLEGEGYSPVDMTYN